MVRGRREQRSVRRAPVLRVAFAWLQSEAIDRWVQWRRILKTLLGAAGAGPGLPPPPALYGAAVKLEAALTRNCSYSWPWPCAHGPCGQSDAPRRRPSKRSRATTGRAGGDWWLWRNRGRSLESFAGAAPNNSRPGPLRYYLSARTALNTMKPISAGTKTRPRILQAPRALPVVLDLATGQQAASCAFVAPGFFFSVGPIHTVKNEERSENRDRRLRTN